MQFRTTLDCGVSMRGNASLGQQKPAVGLEYADERSGKPVGGKSGGERPAGEHFMAKVESRARVEHAADRTTARLARIDAAGDLQQRFARHLLEFAPQLVRAPQQRHVRQVFPVRETDDAREAVRGTALVRDAELLDAEDARAAARRVERRCTAHSADAGDDDVVVGHAVRNAPAASVEVVRWPSVIALNAMVSTQHATMVANTPVQPQWS